MSDKHHKAMVSEKQGKRMAMERSSEANAQTYPLDLTRRSLVAIVKVGMTA